MSLQVGQGCVGTAGAARKLEVSRRVGAGVTWRLVPSRLWRGMLAVFGDLRGALSAGQSVLSLPCGCLRFPQPAGHLRGVQGGSEWCFYGLCLVVISTILSWYRQSSPTFKRRGHRTRHWVGQRHIHKKSVWHGASCGGCRWKTQPTTGALLPASDGLLAPLGDCQVPWVLTSLLLRRRPPFAAQEPVVIASLRTFRLQRLSGRLLAVILKKYFKYNFIIYWFVNMDINFI